MRSYFAAPDSLIALALSSSLTIAAEISADSKIDADTVYPDGAIIGRSGVATVPFG